MGNESSKAVWVLWVNLSSMVGSMYGLLTYLLITAFSQQSLHILTRFWFFSVIRFVILSFSVGNINETRGDLPEVAVIGVKLTNIGLISPLGLYAYLDLKGALDNS